MRIAHGPDRILLFSKLLNVHYLLWSHNNPIMQGYSLFTDAAAETQSGQWGDLSKFTDGIATTWYQVFSLCFMQCSILPCLLISYVIRFENWGTLLRMIELYLRAQQCPQRNLWLWFAVKMPSMNLNKNKNSHFFWIIGGTDTVALLKL